MFRRHEPDWEILAPVFYWTKQVTVVFSFLYKYSPMKFDRDWQVAEFSRLHLTCKSWSLMNMKLNVIYVYCSEADFFPSYQIEVKSRLLEEANSLHPSFNSSPAMETLILLLLR